MDTMSYVNDRLAPLVLAQEAKDSVYLVGHARRVASIAYDLASQIGLPAEVQHSCHLAGLLHDLGKIGIDEGILRKAEPLTVTEFAEIKRHPELGYLILQPLMASGQLAPEVLDGVLCHHEAWDGTGYPRRIAGQEIPFIGRLISVADAFDAMSTTRSYQKALTPDRVRAIFDEGRGKQWDPKIVDVIICLVDPQAVAPAAV